MITRRETMRILAGAGLGGMALAILGEKDALAQACTTSPQMTEGPYYVDGADLRRNVIESRPGVVLWVSLTVVDATTCAPIPGAIVEIWHADASGDYSGVGSLQGTMFLRGRQVVGDAGAATFRTIYPGWYPGRTPHIHTKVLVNGNDVYTGQVFFDEAVTAAVYAQEEYASRGVQDTTNAADGIFDNGGAASMLTLARRGEGYWGKHTIVVPA